MYSVEFRHDIIRAINGNSIPLFVYVNSKHDVHSVQVIKKDAIDMLKNKPEGTFYLNVHNHEMFLHGK